MGSGGACLDGFGGVLLALHLSQVCSTVNQHF